MSKPTTLPCWDRPADMWFVESPEGQEFAAGLCTACPIRTACLDIAMTAERGKGKHDRYGVFGGATPAERAALDQADTVATDSRFASVTA